MSTTFVEFKQPTMMPGGGVAGSGENVGFDPTTAGNFIASAVAVAGSAGCPMAWTVDIGPAPPLPSTSPL